MSKKNKTRVFAENNMLLWICLISSAMFLGLYALIDIFVDSYPKWLGIILFGAIALFILVVYVVYKKKLEQEESFREKTLLMEKAMTGMMKNVDVPCMLTLRSGLIAWCSRGAYEMLDAKESLIQKSFNELFGINIEDLIEKLPSEESDTGDTAFGESETIINEKNYTAKIYRQMLGKNTYYLITFADHTALTNLEDKTYRESPVVAHIVLDNLNEIAEYVKVNYRSAANQIEEILTDFADEIGGFIREYNRDKYIMVFSREKFDVCQSNNFDILERVRNVRLGDSSIPVTISMGISLVGNTFEEREKNASSALEFALQRGGDQVAVKTEDDVLFFGGKAKGLPKNAGTRRRVVANQLAASIASAGNVLIMGHANPDFDAIGACIGLARLSMFCGHKPKIIMDTQNPSFKVCTDKLLELPDYKNVFISAEAGLDMIRSDTLLIIADANNFNILESPGVASGVTDFVVIDHHRKVAEFEHEPIISFIEPSASSASEMVTEFLQYCIPNDALLKEEANVLLAGIMVDTKNFTRTTGTLTLSAAMYLHGAGASAETVSAYFNEDFNNFMSEARFNTNVTMYLDKIAITESDGSNPSFDRVNAAKAADKLLTIRGVEASFALVKINDKIHISARSCSNINVQLILEKLGGGGHFDAAAAAISGTDMKSTLYRLKDAIDDYFANN